MSLFLFRVMATLIVLSIVFAFWRTMGIHDFVVVNDIEPETFLEDEVTL